MLKKTTLRIVVYLCAATAFLVVLNTGCNGQYALPDTTSPRLRLEGSGISKLIILTEDSTDPENGRAWSDDNVHFKAHAYDAETGLRHLSLRGELRVLCVPSTSNRLITIVEPIAETELGSANGASLPDTLDTQFDLQVASQRARCPSTTQFLELYLELRAEAENGEGLIRQLPAAIVSSFGPDIVTVGTFNLHNPGNYSDSVFERWGQTLGSQADILLLTEVRDRRVAELLASAAGKQFVTDYAGLAIASRAPLRNVRRETIDPPGRLTSNDSNILSAQTDLGGYPHQVVVTHWGIRDANDEEFGPERSSPSRLQAAETILNLLEPKPAIVIVGGDLNAYSGIGPQEFGPGVGTAEVNLLRSELTDTFEFLALPNERHCSNQRIDYIFVRGPYRPIRYEACFLDAAPSDHPFVLVTLAAQ